MEALHDVVKSGKVRYIGASSMWAHEFAILQFTATIHGWTKFISMQNFYNLLYREEELGVADKLSPDGLPFFGGEPSL